MTQSFIVYRNPLEAAMWESGLVFPLIGGLSIGFIVFVVGMVMLDKYTKKSWKKPRWWKISTYALATASIALAVYVFRALAN
jgi:NhaP-type Na+/H+ or K+/H+ antiporter